MYQATPRRILDVVKLAKWGAAMCALGALVSVVGILARAMGDESVGRVAQVSAGFPWAAGLVLLLVAGVRHVFRQSRSVEK